ncbi:MAG: hypothetical protein SO117_08895 [Frisingicoccus sp.]|nr:hypothetical protein [Frisingicoccus sp.]
MSAGFIFADIFDKAADFLPGFQKLNTALIYTFMIIAENGTFSA